MFFDCAERNRYRMGVYGRNKDFINEMFKQEYVQCVWSVVLWKQKLSTRIEKIFG